jgi:hypothetical protein
MADLHRETGQPRDVPRTCGSFFQIDSEKITTRITVEVKEVIELSALRLGSVDLQFWRIYSCSRWVLDVERQATGRTGCVLF